MMKITERSKRIFEFSAEDVILLHLHTFLEQTCPRKLNAVAQVQQTVENRSAACSSRVQ